MPEQLLSALKYVLLALLYLFFVRVLWAVWSEVRLKEPSRGPAAPGSAGAVAAAAAAAANTVPQKPSAAGKSRKPRAGTRLVVVTPADQRGQSHAIDEELTIGRAPGCGLILDDTFVSQLHARAFRRGKQLYVEDLGSTNGTFVNGSRITATVAITAGDNVQIGRTVFEVT